MEGLLLAAKAALKFIQSIDGYENSVCAVNLRREIEAVEHSVHPTDGGRSQSDNESKPATISG